MTDPERNNLATGRSSPSGDLELLAPAGDWEALEAALEAGADAVYFGLRTLNARRRAKNFSPDQFVKAVETIHARGAKAYLTLNVDLAQRELGQAARILELARQARADAVLVRDPALLAMRAEYEKGDRRILCEAPCGPFRQNALVPFFPAPFFPAFHFSTQTCMSNSAEVAAAGRLGADRVILAREMSLDEIAAASAVPGVQTEVFVQGALCFSVSGRCLLSSWVGGHSGNRGTCTSPCRVPWSEDEHPAYTPLSMQDLSLIERLPELRQAGVTALKIEGRLKNAAWVRRAVSLYKRSLAGEEINILLQEAENLGAYTGRTMCSDYLDGKRDELTAAAEGRKSGAEVFDDDSLQKGEWTEEPTYDLSLVVGQKGIACSCVCGRRTEKWSIPKTVVRRAHKATSISAFFNQLAQGMLRGYQLGRRETNAPDFLLVPRAVNALIDRISEVIRLAKKAPDEIVRIDLPPAVRELLTVGETSKENRLCLGDTPDRIRLDPNTAADFLRHVQAKGVIIEGLAPNTLRRFLAICRNASLIAALPAVFFEDEIPPIKLLLGECVKLGVTVEVNSWGGWYLAKAAGVKMEAGPGLAVLNSLAAQLLGAKGIKCATLSPEADRRQLEELCAHCAVPCSLVVYGRPPLITTRVRVPDRLLGRILTDRRGVQIIPRLENGLYVFRPVEPFDLRASQNQRIRVKHLVVDLVGSDDPLGDWQNVPMAGEMTFQFNYDRFLA
jgi:putative protease